MKHKHAQAMKSRDFHFEIKAVEKDGFFSGYGSVFGVVDSYREIVAPGAFAASLAARSAKDEALLRAYEMSGAASVEAFADMYGMRARTVAQQLDRARRLKNA